jgi:hypothetical protein
MSVDARVDLENDTTSHIGLFNPGRCEDASRTPIARAIALNSCRHGGLKKVFVADAPRNRDRPLAAASGD